MAASLSSTRFPYIPVQVKIRGEERREWALVDTGFAGKLIVPDMWMSMDIGNPDGQGRWRVADGRVAIAPSYVGELRLGDDFAQFAPIRCDVLGDHYIVGRDIVALFDVRLDHGNNVVITP
jgi:predicted aspartyl protease